MNDLTRKSTVLNLNECHICVGGATGPDVDSYREETVCSPAGNDFCFMYMN